MRGRGAGGRPSSGASGWQGRGLRAEGRAGPDRPVAGTGATRPVPPASPARRPRLAEAGGSGEAGDLGGLGVRGGRGTWGGRGAFGSRGFGEAEGSGEAGGIGRPRDVGRPGAQGGPGCGEAGDTWKPGVRGGRGTWEKGRPPPEPAKSLKNKRERRRRRKREIRGDAGHRERRLPARGQGGVGPRAGGRRAGTPGPGWAPSRLLAPVFRGPAVPGTMAPSPHPSHCASKRPPPRPQPLARRLGGIHGRLAVPLWVPVLAPLLHQEEELLLGFIGLQDPAA